MKKFELARKKDTSTKILCLGAHGDDIEIGCGGTLLRFLSEHIGLEVFWVVFSSGGQRNREAEASAEKFLAGATGTEIMIKDYEDGFFPCQGGEIKKFFETLKTRISPDLIFSHFRHDLHQDHRLISELTWNTFRDHLILEYEVIKYDGDLGTPNFFVHLSETICRKKIDYITSSFDSQKCKSWFTPDAFFSILRIRGIEANAPDKYAEGFYARKLVI
jgi:LmbE family N-acetylglucosaminyl deacetylase